MFAKQTVYTLVEDMYSESIVIGREQLYVQRFHVLFAASEHPVT